MILYQREMRKTFQLLIMAMIALQWIHVSAQQKNILFIAVDDLKPNIGAYGDEFARTPNMDRLAAEGYVFLNNYVQQAVCGRARARLLTGWRPDRTQVLDLQTLIRDKNPDVVTLPQHFRKNGYVTYGTGKIFDPRSVDKKYDARSWSIPYTSPDDLPGSTPDPVLGAYQLQDHIMQYQLFASMADAKGLKGNKKNTFIRESFKPSTEKADVPDDAYTDGRIANDALQKIDEFSQGDEPFLLMVGFKKPHLPFVAPAKYWDMYNPKDIELAEYQKRSKGGPDMAYHNSGELRSYTDIPEHFDDNGILAKDKQRELIHGYYAATSYIDAQIGKLIDKLEEKGLLSNTIIVLWGDHGWHLGDHGLWCKHTNFEQATRSPLIIFDPSKTPGKTSIPVETLDVFPTLCELAGIDPVPTLQGISLVPLLDGGEPEKTYAISQWPIRHKNGMGYTIRTERYRYTEWYKDYAGLTPRSDDNIIGRELYDYQEDPLETKNLVDDKDLAGIVDEHVMLLHQFLAVQVGTATAAALAGPGAEGEVPGSPRGTPIRQLVEKNFAPGTVYVGATTSFDYLQTEQGELLAKQFSYTTPENAVKQSVVHPDPETWRWNKIDKILKYAEKNNIVVRLHGPVSPQASKWAKDDSRTPDELLQNMTEYMTEQCKRYNGHPVVKWMDVVNETVDRKGEWFGPKPGTDKWENPWLSIGLNEDGIPIYIVKAFEIATAHAPDIKLVLNQHLGMEPNVWEKIKELVIYLRVKGYRVDGIGWQAHLRSDVPLALDEKELEYLASLIDWAHANKLEFHVTEIDYRIVDNQVDEAALGKQAEAYANILKVLLSKRSTGVVTFNTWGLNDGDDKSEYHNEHRFIFDKQLRAKPAYYAIQAVLENPDGLSLATQRESTVDDGKNLLENAGFENDKKPWVTFGEADVASDGSQRSGSSCVKLSMDKSGAKQKVNVKPNTDYVLTAWVKSENSEKVRLKVKVDKLDLAGKVSTSNDYKKITLEFNSGENKEVSINFTKWNSGNSPAWADDFYLIEKQ